MGPDRWSAGDPEKWSATRATRTTRRGCARVERWMRDTADARVDASNDRRDRYPYGGPPG